MDDSEGFRGATPGRRVMLGAGLLASWLIPAARAQTPDAMHPQPGDQFVFLTGPKKGQVIKVEDLPVGGPQVQAYPRDPKSGTVRDGTPYNLVLLARFATDTLAPDTRDRAADGMVAYSAICTHQGCPVNAWSSEKKDFVCNCHGSTYDPRDGAKVVWGPAPRPLPSLGLKVADGAPVVASSFSSRVGPEKA